MKNLFILVLLVAFPAGLPITAFAGIAGSRHDFSASTFGGGQICILCHTPHNADISVIEAPLWNHEVTTATYTVYSSPTLEAMVGQPSGSTKLCLSCHDGTVAVDSFGGNTGVTFIVGDENLGTNLSDDHPISFRYDTALSIADTGLNDPATTMVTIGSGNFTKTGTVEDIMLEGGQLQCSACHSVHNDFVVNDTPSAHKLLKISISGSALCLACHLK